MNPSLLSLVMLTTAATAIAHAETTSSQHEHIVVTGTRTAKLLSNSPVLVEVVDGETIAKISQGTMAQALNYIPGVVVTRSVKDGYNVQMQGFDGDHVLVLIDGQTIISPTGSSADLDQIPANNIAQIEVIRGAASVMYGSSAMGGVINIITNQSAEPALQFDYDVSQYQGNTIKDNDLNHTFKLNAVEQFNGWRTNFNALVIDNQGFDYDQTTVSQDAASVDKVFIRLGASKPHSNDITTSINYQLLDEMKKRDSSKIPGRSDVIFYQTDVNQHQLDIGVKGNSQPQSPWQLNARYISHQETSGQSNSLRNTDITLAEINGQQVFQFKQLALVAGGVLHSDKLDQTKPAEDVIEINDKHRESAELYLQANWINDSYQLLAGMRSQYDSDFNWHHAMRLSTMANFQLAKSQLQWRAGVGQSYRVPNLKERFYLFDHSALGYMVLGNAHLEPETANSINSSLTFDTSIADGRADVNVDFSLHYSKTKDLIDTVVDTDMSEQQQLAIYHYQNINKADIYGVNVSTELNLSDWQLQLNYSYLDSKDSNNQRLFSRPRHQLKLNIKYEVSAYDLELIAYALYQADEAVPTSYRSIANNEYTTVTALITQAITDQLSWRISMANIFDQHQASNANRQNLFDARPVSSRTISAGVSYQF
ncbi:TonB-dependent receptor [Thalassotalea insulae]|uniref:TonB-dependent receptor n=1 Tax=Thalassotalea insulae TaxID=2056778 RepID=A0ABQ6GRK0_9GAMM|nr:TonB-dependent receptor [Thalassotalea insulae]GLX78578.1 TonB-dependent receptor [Thalassotalea insulae]